MDPVINPAVEGLIQIPVSSRGNKGASLHAEVGTCDKHGADHIPYNFVDLGQIAQGDLTLSLKDLPHVFLPGHSTHIPFFDIPDALGILQLRSRHKGDIAKAGTAEAADNGFVCLVVQPLHLGLEVLQLPIGDRLELLNIVLWVELVIIDGILPDDGIKIESAFGHSAAGRC